MFFAKFNSYGSATDVGFANTWQVASFPNRAARDAWVAQRAERKDVAPITKAQALKLAGEYQRSLHRNGGHLAHVHYLTDDAVKFVPAF